MEYSAQSADELPNGIYAPAQQDDALQARIAELRASGERVVSALPGHEDDARQMGCDRKLVKEKNKWVVSPVKN
jgi:ATP phosphoribosyltransferase regulatory subunit